MNCLLLAKLNRPSIGAIGRDTAEALRYIGEGHAQGKIVITMEPASKT